MKEWPVYSVTEKNKTKKKASKKGRETEGLNYSNNKKCVKSENILKI